MTIFTGFGNACEVIKRAGSGQMKYGELLTVRRLSDGKEIDYRACELKADGGLTEIAGVTEKLTPHHMKDEDCSVDPSTNLCTVCGVEHGEACPVCGGRGFHKEGCAESDATNTVDTSQFKVGPEPDFGWTIRGSPTVGVAIVLSLSPAMAQLIADALVCMEPSGDNPDQAEELATVITERLRVK
jgi:hypothetical protein